MATLRRPEDDIPGYGGPVPAKTGNLPGEFSRNLNNAANSLGGLGVVASTPLKVANAATKVASPALQMAYDGAGPLQAGADFISGMGSNATTVRAGAQVPATIPRTLPRTNAALQEGAQANVLAAAGRTAAGGNAAAGTMSAPDRKLDLLPQAGMAWMGGSAPGPQGSLTRTSLRQAFPGTAATLAGSGEDFTGALREGRYTDATGHAIRQIATTPLAVADDVSKNIFGVAGGFAHGVDKLMTGPVEGAGRVALGLPPREPPRAAPDSEASAAQPNPTDTRLAAGTQTSPMAPSAPSASAATPGNQVAPGIYQYGRGQYSDNPNGMGMPAGFTGQPNAQNMTAADNLAARDTLRSQGAAAASMPSATPMPNLPTGRQLTSHELRNLEVSAKSITNQKRWGGEGEKSADVQAYLRAVDLNNAQRAGADPGSVARTNAQASMYGDNVRSEATRYGSDNSLRGALASADAARATGTARLRYDIDKDNRDFKLRDQEAGLKRNEQRLKQREASEKNMVDRIATSIPPGPDGKPNTAAAAEQVRAMTARMADRQRQLEAELARDPSNEQARGELANILDNGVGAMGMTGMDNFQTGMEAKSLRRDNAGWMPWKGKDAKSNKPITSLRREDGLLWNFYVDDQGGRIPEDVINDRREQFKHLIQE